jgi:hypothetical protein
MKDYLVDALMEHFKESNPDAIKEIHEYIDKHGAITLRFDMLETDFAKYELREKLKKLEYIPNNAFSAIKKVYFNDPATVVLWADGTKTIVRAENEEYDPEKGLAMAIAKKSLGNKGSYYETFKKWLPEVVVDESNSVKEAVKAIKKLGQTVGQGLRDGLLSGCGEEKEDENNDSN